MVCSANGKMDAGKKNKIKEKRNGCNLMIACFKQDVRIMRTNVIHRAKIQNYFHTTIYCISSLVSALLNPFDEALILTVPAMVSERRMAKAKPRYSLRLLPANNSSL